MANSAYIITRVENSIVLLEADYAPKGYPLGVYMNPGGKIDFTDPDILTGAIREWEEEMGLTFPVSRTEVSLLGIFSQEDGTHCFVFFIHLNSLDLSKEVIPGEVKSRRLFSLNDIEELQANGKIFNAQFRFISWFTQVLVGEIMSPVYNRVIPAVEPSLKKPF